MRAFRLPVLLAAASTGCTGAVDEKPSDSATDLPACLSTATHAALATFVVNLDLIAHLAPSTATPSTVVAFYQLPGLDISRAIELNLTQPCTAAADLDPTCLDTVCFQTECTGEGGGWIEHAEDVGAGDVVTQVDGWAIDRGRADIAWAEGEARFDLVFDVRGLTGPDGLAYGFEGTGTMDGTLDLDLVFPALHPDGPLRLTIVDSADGGLEVGGVSLGRWNGGVFVQAACS